MFKCICVHIYIYTQICSIYTSTNEEKHLRPGHHWLCQFWDASDGTSCENEFKLQVRKWEDYKGTRFYDGERALVIKRWLNRVDEDASGLTFEEWDPTENVDSSQMPVAMILNSCELRAAGFTLWEVFPPELETAAHHRSTRGAGIWHLEGIRPKRFTL